MSTCLSRYRVALFYLGMAIGAAYCEPGYCQQATVTLRNGMVVGTGFLEKIGGLEPTGSVNKTAPTGHAIEAVDTGLFRTYVNSNAIVNRAPAPTPFKIDLIATKNEVPSEPKKLISHVGSVSSTTPFDRFGRRVYNLFETDGKAASVVQGITEISSKYVRVEAQKGDHLFGWDMRMSLSAIPPDTLAEILMTNANPNVPQDWLDISQLYWDAHRYTEARAMLVKAIRKFPELEAQRSQLKELDQLLADQLFAAVVTAQDAGQHKFADSMLKGFATARLSEETKLKIESKIDRIAKDTALREQLIQSLRNDVSNLPDPAAKKDCEPILDEISSFLSADTQSRFVDYIRLQSDAKLGTDQRVALGIGGWLMGAGTGKDNLSIVRSSIHARELIREYLASPRRNDQLIEELGKMEAGTPDYVARIVANMPPPIPVDEANAVQWKLKNNPDSPEEVTTLKVPGRYLFEVALDGPMRGRTVRYAVQLPEEYNPYRRYPCVFTLPSEMTSIEGQLEWWTSFDPTQKRCTGEAARHGYIVVSPEWNEPKQPLYNFTENEHAAILAPLRDAFRRFSIDTDRVFISGHFMGADAAWDVAWAHPDLWAGAIIIGGFAKKYILNYYENARYVPSYFVNGQLDGENPEMTNGRTWDRILDRFQFDAMVTLYRGRGVDHFQEELPRIITWMDLPNHRRNFAPSEFSITTARHGDRFFWWFETDSYNANKLVHPLLYKSGSEYKVQSKINKESNLINFDPLPASRCTVWLSPDYVDLSRKVTIQGTKGRKSFDVKGKSRVLLEDVRSRGDRQHPFWDRIDFQN